MAFTFGATTGDGLQVGAKSSLANLTSLTCIMWCRPTTITAGHRLFVKGLSSSTTVRWLMFMDTGTGTFGFAWGRATTTSQWYSANNAIIKDRWNCVAASINQTGPVRNLYYGYLDQPMTAVSSYGTDVNGSGSFGDDSALPLSIGNDAAGTPTLAFQGDIGPCAVFNRALAQDEIESWRQFPKRIAGCIGLWQPGFHGAGGRLMDLSGYGNDISQVNGTVTMSAHPPLSIYLAEKRFANLRY